MSQETLEFLLWILGGIYLVTVIGLYWFYHFSWKHVIQRQDELTTRAQSSINRGIIAEEHARNLAKSMQKVLDTYKPTLFKEEDDKPIDK